MRSTTRRILLTAVLATASTAARADTIYLVDGSSVPDCTIETEGLLKVEYRVDNKSAAVDSDKVLAVEFSRRPQLLDRAEAALADELIADAIDELEEYVKGVLASDKPPRRYTWAPAHAMYRLAEIHETEGDARAVVAAADRLIKEAPESRYVPFALLKKAQAQSDLDKASDAQVTVDALATLIEERGLSERWKLERELAKVLFDDSLKGSALRSQLGEISKRAGSAFPIARNRADVAIGESFLEEKKLDAAEKLFEQVAADPKADDRTLAAAYTGLGDCLFQKGVKQGSGGEAAATLREALMNYMRVVVVYKEEPRYAPKAMFYAGRVFQLLNDEESEQRAQQLYRAVIREYGDTSWAGEARGFRK